MTIEDHTITIEINRLDDLAGTDPDRYATMFQSIDDVTGEEDIVCCEAFDDDGFQIGHLIIDTDGLILGVEVKPEHRRKGIATLMLNKLRQAGYSIQHDWENMRDDGAAWAASLGKDQKAFGRGLGARGLVHSGCCE